VLDLDKYEAQVVAEGADASDKSPDFAARIHAATVAVPAL
jgi:hypothetical protein